MKIVDYKILEVDVESDRYDKKVNNLITKFNNLANDGWIYKEELKGVTALKTYLFYKLNEEVTMYNKEILEFIKP